MFDILRACPDGDFYTSKVSHLTDIEHLVGSPHIEAVSTADPHLVFWFNPHLPISRRVNPPATESLLATTGFTARSVPLLRGDVVLTRHDSAGNLMGLNPRELDWLINVRPTCWEEVILGRRFAIAVAHAAWMDPPCARAKRMRMAHTPGEHEAPIRGGHGESSRPRASPRAV